MAASKAQQPPARSCPARQAAGLSSASSGQRWLSNGVLCTTEEKCPFSEEWGSYHTRIHGRATGFEPACFSHQYLYRLLLQSLNNPIPSHPIPFVPLNFSSNSVQNSHPSTHFLSSVLISCFAHLHFGPASTLSALKTQYKKLISLIDSIFSKTRW